MHTTTHLSLRNIGFIAAAIAAILAVTVAIALRTNAAAVITAAPGVDTIQAAITAASDGDTIQLSAGDYIGDVRYDSNTSNKSLTFIGVPGTVIKPGTTIYPNFAAAGAQSITLKNITFDGGSATPAKTGLDINSIVHVTLENVTVKNYLKNGISITASYDAGVGGDFSDTATKSATLTNVTTDNTAWAGIALYEAGVGPYLPLSGIVFNGTTSVSNSAYGIQLGKSSASLASSIRGADDAPVNLGHVVLAGNTQNISGGTAVPAYVATDSTVDGQPVTAALLGANVTIGTPPAVVAPGVPNTATARP